MGGGGQGLSEISSLMKRIRTKTSSRRKLDTKTSLRLEVRKPEISSRIFKSRVKNGWYAFIHI